MTGRVMNTEGGEIWGNLRQDKGVNERRLKGMRGSGQKERRKKVLSVQVQSPQLKQSNAWEGPVKFSNCKSNPCEIQPTNTRKEENE